MKRVPVATYRLQLNRNFTLRQAADAADYLLELGVSDAYVSPVFQAGPESTHGYDVCDFSKIDPALGTEDDFNRFAGTLKELGLGLLVDMVPNHMAAALTNRWWFDVLENGRDSPYATRFDIDWEPANPALRNRVLLPVLEDHYATVLAAGKLQLMFANEKFFITCHNRQFPVAPATVAVEAKRNPQTFLDTLNGKPGEPRSFNKLDALIRRQHYRLAFWRIAPQEINYRRFFDVADFVALRMERAEVFHATHEFLFRMIASGRITGLRIDHPDGLWNPREYFERLQEGIADCGLRIADFKTGALRADSHSEFAAEPANPGAVSQSAIRNPQSAIFYVVAEKILSVDERLPTDWPVDGTTGYDFLNRVNGLFVNSAGEAAFDALYGEFTRSETDFGKVARESKRRVLARSFPVGLRWLANKLYSIAGNSRSGVDLTCEQIHFALGEVIVAFPVYRSYLTEDAAEVSEADRAHIEQALHDARLHNPALDDAVFKFIEKLLLLELDVELDDAGIKASREFILRFQQFTAPVTAKGIEDTAFYNFNRLISLNEVGGDPDIFGITPAAFHEANLATAASRPHTLLASATHDTKRGEDVRARIHVLSEMPDAWRDAIGRWSQLNAGRKLAGDGQRLPHANDEYLLYQTLIGAWPWEGDTSEALTGFRERVTAFMLKAVREAKVHTSWIDPDATYERAVTEFTEQILTENATNTFLDDFRRFQRRVAFFGQFNSLAQTLLKITSPGVPDFYQGNELWDFNLVDPDNRRPVDYEIRRQMLADLKAEFTRITAADPADPSIVVFFSELLKDAASGRIKLFLIWRALEFRRRHRDLFDCGAYVPLQTTGAGRNHLCAFARTHEGKGAITIVPRLVYGLVNGTKIVPLGAGVWGDTAVALPEVRAGESFRNVFTGEIVQVKEHQGSVGVEVADALSRFPVALLEKV